MIALTYGIDASWLQALSQSSLFSVVKTLGATDWATSKTEKLEADLVLYKQELHEDEPWTIFASLRTMYPKARIFMIPEHSFDPLNQVLFLRLADRYQCSILSPEITAGELLSCMGYSNDKEDRPTGGRVITGWGLSPGSGVTTVLYHLAFNLARETGLKVGLFDLNFRSPDLQRLVQQSSVKHYMHIQSDLASGLLTPLALEKAMVPHKGMDHLYMLFGSNRREYAQLISMGEIHELIRVAKLAFDIVILDVNAYPDNAATLQSMKQSDVRLAITDGREISYFASWQDWYENVLSFFQFLPNDFHLILNRNDNHERLEGISSVTGMNQLSALPYVSSFNTPPWELAIKGVCAEAAHLLDIPWETKKVPSSSSWYEKLGRWSWPRAKGE